MALVKWDPARELDTLQSDVNRIFDGFFGRTAGSPEGSFPRRWIPAMDVVETDDHLILRADLPGLAREEIEIEVKDSTLTITGERRAEHEDKGEGYHRIERSFGRFARSLELPRGVDPGAVEAGFEHGVLEVRVPKPEERRPTRVEIGAGSSNGDGAAADG